MDAVDLAGEPFDVLRVDVLSAHDDQSLFGFSKVAIEPLTDAVTVGDGNLDRAVDIMLQIGPAGAALREAGMHAHPAVVASVRDAIAPYHSAGAGVRLPAAAWLVTARG